MSLPIIYKFSEEKYVIGLLYFAPDLEEGETIDSVETSVNPAGLTLDGAASIDGNEVSQMINGGTFGVKYIVSFKVTTSAGHIYIDTYSVRIK